MIKAGNISRIANASLLVGLLFASQLLPADDAALSDYDAGKRFGELSVRFMAELTKKNLKEAGNIEKERALFRRDQQLDYAKGIFDGLMGQDMSVIAKEAGLDQQGTAHLYVFYYSMVYGIEQTIKAMNGETPAESDGEELYVRAAQAAFNDGSKEKVEELKESFYYLSVEMQELAQAAA